MCHAWHLLRASHGTARVADVARAVGWSERHLAARFRAEIGLTPKAAARVIRFDRARRMIPGSNGAIVAATCGYADQSHLVRDFVEFTGLRPECLARRRGRKSSSRRRRRGSRLGVMSDKTPPPTVWPTLRANDARALIRFLVDVVGFEETAVYGEGDVVHHAELSWPLGGGIMLGSARDDGRRRADAGGDSAAPTSSSTSPTRCARASGRGARR